MLTLQSSDFVFVTVRSAGREAITGQPIVVKSRAKDAAEWRPALLRFDRGRLGTTASLVPARLSQNTKYFRDDSSRSSPAIALQVQSHCT